MGIKQTTVITCTCDVCGNDCDHRENRIEIEIASGERDIGPSYIHAIVQVEKPYCVSGGIVCRSCQTIWLGKYLDRIRGQ